MVTLVVSGLGYEGRLVAFDVEGETMGEAYRNAYAYLNHYDEDDMEDYKEYYGPTDNQWKDPEYWLDEIETMDSADFVLGSIYHVEEKKFLYSN